jgi:hypothetical protein
LSSGPVKATWLDRHAGWKIALGGLLVIVLVGVFAAIVFTAVETSFRKSDVYQQALDRAVRDPQVVDRVGVPLRPGRVLQGQLNVSGSSGKAHMVIPVTGPRGKATIHLYARKAAGTWRFLVLQVEFEEPSGCLDLLAEPGAASSGCSAGSSQ